MAKAKKRTKVTTVEETEGAADDAPPDAEVSLDAPAADAESDAMAALLSLDDSDGIRFRVHKEPSKPGERRAYCNDYTRDSLSLDTIRATFGGGVYRITAYNAENQYVSSKQLAIAELPKEPASAAPAVDVAALLAARGSDGSTAMMLKMFEAQSAMLTALLAKPAPVAPAGPTPMELISMIKALQPAKSDTDPIELLMKGLELGRSLGDSGGSDMLGLAGKALETLGPAIAAGVAKQNGANGAAALPAPPSRAANPQPQPAQPAQPQRSPAEMDTLKKLNWLNRLTAELCQRAARAQSADTYAEVMLDNLPPFISIDEIQSRMADPNCVAQLAQLNPSVTVYAAWFEEFRQAVLDMLVDTEGDQSQGEQAPQDNAGGLDS